MHGTNGQTLLQWQQEQMTLQKGHKWNLNRTLVQSKSKMKFENGMRKTCSSSSLFIWSVIALCGRKMQCHFNNFKTQAFILQSDLILKRVAAI